MLESSILAKQKRTTPFTLIISKLGEYQADQSVFMKRICGDYYFDKPTKIDVIRHYYQIEQLYAALEMRLENPLFSESKLLSIFKQPPLLGRLSLLKDDLTTMKRLLSQTMGEQNKKNANVYCIEKVLPATKAIIKSIQNADEQTLFAFLSVRTISDRFGGKNLAEYACKTFGLDVEKQKDPEQAYFKFSHSAVACKELLTFVNDATLDNEAEYCKAIDTILEFHLNLFKELEEERDLSCTSRICTKLPPLSSIKSRAGFFAVSGLAVVAATAVTFTL